MSIRNTMFDGPAVLAIAAARADALPALRGM